MINCIKGYHALVKAKVYNQFSRLSITELGMRKFQQVTIYKQLVRLSEALSKDFITSNPPNVVHFSAAAPSITEIT